MPPQRLSLSTIFATGPDAMSAQEQAQAGDWAEDMMLRAKLNGETATAPWRELQRLFAQGAVVSVAPGLDLVEVGLAMSRDQAGLFQSWLAGGQVTLATDAQARAWLDADAHLWALVIKPWVLVQEPKPGLTRVPPAMGSLPLGEGV
jgi:hypothetical protein